MVAAPGVSLPNDCFLHANTTHQQDTRPAFPQEIETGILVTNPPYGERLNPRDLIQIYASINERLKHVFAGYDAWIISSNPEGFDKIGLKPTFKCKLINGAQDCKYRRYQIFSGKHKEHKRSV